MDSAHTRRLAEVAVAVSLLLTACTSVGSSEDDLSLQDHARQAFMGQGGLERVTVDEVSSGTEVTMSVVMDINATPEQVADAATTGREFSEDHAKLARWSTQLYLGDPASLNSGEGSVSAPVQIDLYPTIHDSAGDDARTAMQISRLPGVTRTAITAGTAYIETDTASGLHGLLTALRSQSVWADGGSLQAESGRVRVMDSPRRVTADQLGAIFTAASTYPQGEFWLEAAAQGERYPELYINKVTTTEAKAITRAFTRPSLRSDNAEGYELDFTMRSFGADSEPKDSTGTFGLG